MSKPLLLRVITFRIKFSLTKPLLRRLGGRFTVSDKDSKVAIDFE